MAAISCAPLVNAQSLADIYVVRPNDIRPPIEEAQDFIKQAGPHGARSSPPDLRDLPSDSFSTCEARPATVYKLFARGDELSSDRYAQWADYAQSLSAWYEELFKAQDSRFRLNAAASLDQAMRDRLIIELNQSAATRGASEFAAVNAMLCLIDRANRRILDEALEKGAWPYGDYNGGDLSSSAFLLFQHVPLRGSAYTAYFGIIEAAFANDKIDPFDYARAYDRYHIEKFGSQRYGTQYTNTHQGRLIEDARTCRAEIDKARAEIGIQPLETDAQIILDSGLRCE